MSVSSVVWPVLDLPARVAAHDAVVVSASLLADPCQLERALDMLAPDERVRFGSYGNDVVARRFARGRGLVREMLSAVLGIAPRAVQLREGVHGKLYLSQSNGRALWFSVAHTDELLLVAMSRLCDVGVDVERARSVEQWQRMADRVLDQQERRQLDQSVAGGEDAGLAFLRHWCRVEAELKAIGCGIAGLESHRAGRRPPGLRIMDLCDISALAEPGALSGRYQGALALCTPGADSARQMTRAMAQLSTPTASPASESTA